MRQKIPHFKGGPGPYAKFINKVSKKQLYDSYLFILISGIKVLRVRVRN